ncbi:MAG: SDR family oxidoreductase [Sphingomicrobium sp.]
MDLGIRDKVAIIAGGTRGCGLGISLALAAEGARVLVSGRNQGNADEAVAAIEASGGKAAGVAADMATDEGADTIVQAAHDAFGPPAILVVNPRPASQSRGFNNVTDADFADANRTWVMSLVCLARRVLPHMQSAGWGRILYMGSVGMKVLHLDDPMYAQNVRVAAAAVVKTLAHEYGKFGITANTIATGPFMTGLTNDYVEGGGLAENAMISRTASGRWGTPAEMGAVAAFLCSAPASFITGETIRVDSGYTHSLF